MGRNILSMQKSQQCEYVVNQRYINLILADIQNLKPIKFGNLSLKPFSVDTETTGLDFFKNKLLLLQLAVNGSIYVIDVRKVNIDPLKEVLESDKYLHVLQNAKFDWKALFKHRNIKVKSIFDTQLAESLIQAGNKKETNLEFLAKYYCNINLNKDVVNTFVDFPYDGEFSEEQIEYAANDVKYLLTIFNNQFSFLSKHSLLRIAQLEFKLVEPVATMELRGIILDADRWKNSFPPGPLSQTHKNNCPSQPFPIGLESCQMWVAQR
jgi:ribonuclease D